MHEPSGSIDEQHCNQLFARIAALENRVTELEETRDQQREERHALVRENHELRTTCEQLKKRVETTDAEHDELNERIDRADASRGHIIEDIVDVESQLDEIATGSADPNNGDSTETTLHHSEMTPIERLSMMDTEDTGIDVTPSIERAISIFDHWREWSTKTPKGHVLKSGLKTLLRTATGEKLAWRQVYRACEALEELSKQTIQFYHHDQHGKMLIEPPGPVRSENGDCHASSAARS